MFSMSLWKEFQLLQILNNLFIKYLIKLILYENDVKIKTTWRWKQWKQRNYCYNCWIC